MPIDPSPGAAAFPSDVFFTRSVKEIQGRRGSRASYERKAESGGFETHITQELADWLAQRDSFYLATANAEGQPYMQHRGGPPGFLRALDASTLAFADYRGNRQYITLGNLAENDRAMIFVMDYENRSRIKIWGRARVVENDPDLIASLMPVDYQAKPEQAILFTVEVWDANRPQHIPQKVDAAEVAPIILKLKDRIATLESELAKLRQTKSGAGSSD
jgi:predicted pyridoxine 5'-phosphate oxidase superfamily flavin-nucleotide-binding protein